MRKLYLIITAIFMLVGLMPSSVRATVSPNINLSKLTGYQGEATIAIDPTNPNRMFASSNLSTAGMFAAYSTDGGTTWTSRTIAAAGNTESLPVACCDPIAAFDKFGNLYLAYLTNSPINVVVALSTNGGQTFSGTTLAGGSHILGMFPLDKGDSDVPDKRYDKEKPGSEGETDALNTSGDQPTVATGPSDIAGQESVWVTWSSGGIRAIGTHATALGAVTPFSGTGVTSPTGGNFGDIEVGPSGQVLVISQSPASGQGPSNINASLDPDGLGPGIFQPPTFVTATTKQNFWMSNDLFGASILATATNVGGFDVIPAQPNRTIDAEADLAWDKSGGIHNGRVYLAYTEETVNENNDTNILVRFSDNNGTTWSAPVKANDDATTRSQFFPKIEVDQTNGNIAVAFYDCRNDASGTDATANTEAEVYGAVSKNGGLTFLPNEKISQGSSRSPSFANANEYGDYNGLAFRNNKYFYIWADNSNSTADNPNGTRSSPDLYTAKVTVLTPTAATATVSGRVYTPTGRGLGNAFVIMTNQNGESVSVRTNQFGYYHFKEVQSGETYIFSVASKRYQFASQVVDISEDFDGLNFFAQ
jgi:Carboxypeptidase regulatory-like domain